MPISGTAVLNGNIDEFNNTVYEFDATVPSYVGTPIAISINYNGNVFFNNSFQSGLEGGDGSWLGTAAISFSFTPSTGRIFIVMPIDLNNVAGYFNNVFLFHPSSVAQPTTAPMAINLKLIIVYTV